MADVKDTKDLKFYRFMIVMAFVASIVIAIIVGVNTIDSYKAEASLTNSFLDVLMPKSITDTEDGTTGGMTFYCERNKDYDAEKDQPINAFTYYYKTSEGKRVDLKDGEYFPAGYYMDPPTETSTAVYLAFYYKAMQKLQIVKNVLSIVGWILGVILFGAFIYVWYRSWCKREDAKKARQEEYNKKFGNR